LKRGSIVPKETAFLNRRDYVIPADVQQNFKEVAAHRIILKPKARINNVTVDNLLDDILHTVKPPRIITKDAGVLSH
jgi:MoxR-like ATPase